MPSATSTTWTGGGGNTDFNDPANWSAGVPSAGTDAVINGSSAAPLTVSLTQGADSAHTLRTKFATLDVSGGALSIVAASTLDALEQSGGVLRFENSGPGGGTSGFTGSVTQTAGTLQVDAGSLDLLGTGALGGAVTGGGTVVNAGAAALDGLTAGGNVVLENQGTATLGNAILHLGDGTASAAGLLNDAGAVFDLTDDGSIEGGAAFGRPAVSITNAGLFEKSGGVNVSAIDAPFANTGEVVASRGTLAFLSVNSYAGSIGGDGTVAFDAPRNTLAPGVTMTVAAVALGGALVLGTDVAYDGALLSFGHVLDTGTSTLTLNNAANNLAGASVIGSGALVNTNTLALDGVTLGGGVRFDNTKTATLAGDALTLGDTPASTAKLVNHAGAVFKITDDGGILGGPSNGSPKTSISNAGLFEKTGGTGSTVDIPFTNTGTVLADSGALQFAARTVLGGTVDGSGTIELDGASNTLAADVVLTVATVALGGALAFKADLTYAGVLLASGQTLVLNGHTLMLDNALDDITGVTAVGGGNLMNCDTLSVNGVTVGDSVVLANEGTISLVGHALVLGEAAGSTASFVNDADATFEMQSAASIAASGPDVTVVNNGLFDANGGQNDVFAPFTNGGSLRVTAGGLTLHAANDIAAGVLGGGTWDIAGTVAFTAGGAISTDAAAIVLKGPDAGFLSTPVGGAPVALETTMTSIAAGGILALMSGRSFATESAISDAGTIGLVDGTLVPAALTLEAGGTLIGFGSVLSHVTGAGRIEASGGNLVVGGGSGSAVVDAVASLELAAPFSGHLTLAPFGAPTLVLDAPDDFIGTIDGLAAGDALHFKNVLVDSAALLGKTLQVTIGSVTRTYDLGAALPGNSIVISPDATGTGSNLVVSSASFAPAVAVVNAPSTIDIGNQRVGSGGEEALSVTNAATPPAEALDATISASGVAIASGILGLLAAGQTSPPGLLAGLSSDTPGIVTGSAVIAFFSDGAGTSGSAPHALPSQTLALVGTYYALAAAAFSTPSIVHAGGSGTIDLAVQNVGTPTAFAEGLRAVVESASGALGATGTTGLIAAGSTDTSSLALIIPTVAGVVTGAVTVDLHSDGTGTSGFAPLHLGEETIAVTVTVDNFATATLEKTGGAGSLVANGNTVRLDFGTLAQGAAAVTADIDVLNSAAGPADLLSGAFGDGNHGGAFTDIGFNPFAALAPGTAGGASSITFTPGALGAFSEKIFLSPNGSNASGFSQQLPNQTLVVSGTVAAGLAQPRVNTESPINFGSVRIGTPLSQPLSITNAASALGQGLDVTAAGSGAITVIGSIDHPLAAGTTDATSLLATLDTGAAGIAQGTATLAFSSDDGGGTITPLTGVDATIDFSGTVYAEASFDAASPAPVILHVGDAGAGSIVVGNTAAAPFAENLIASVLGSIGGVSANVGATQPIAPQSSGDIAYTIDTTTAAVIDGAVPLGFVTDGTGIDGAGATPIGGRTVAIAATVNNFATAALQATAGTLTRNGNQYVLDLGTVAVGSAAQSIDLSVLNGASGPADLLSGTLTPVAGNGFIDSGAGAFSDLAAGASAEVEHLTIDPTTAGNFSETLSLQSSGSNASGFNAALAGITLTVEEAVETTPAIFATVLGVGGSTVTIPFTTASNAAAAQIALNSISDAVRAGTLTQLAFGDLPAPSVTSPLFGLVELNSSTVPLPGLALCNNSVSAVLDGASQQVMMTGLPGNNTVVVGRGGAVIGNLGVDNKIFFGGGGVQQFAEADLAQLGIISSAEVWLDGDATFDDSAGSTLIHLGSVSGGAGAVATSLTVTDNGVGTTTIDVGVDTTGTAASDLITLDGTGDAATTVNAAGGADSLGNATGGVPLAVFVGTGSGFINGNGSNVTLFGGGTGAVTLLGGGGTDIDAGAAGLIEAGTGGGSMLFGSTVPGATTLIGGGAGDVLTSVGRNTLMIAGRGSEWLAAFQPSIFRGMGGAQAPGAVTLFQAQTGGNSYLPGNGQTSIASVADANGGNLFEESVSGADNSATISGFVSGVDSISGANPAGGQYALVTGRAPGPQEMSLAVNGATSTLTFGDGTTWIFASVVQVGDFVNVASQGGV